MIACKHCVTENSLDSAFCKSCGLELPADERDAVRTELQKLVTEGYALLGQNRTEEAALVAQKVLEDMPNSSDALSLLGMCHERNEDLLAALQCYERVVELNPDSALDKIKVQSLRNALSRHLKEDKKPNRLIALVGAAAAIIVVASIGGIVATLVARPASATVAQNETTPVMDMGAPFATGATKLPTTDTTQTSTQGTIAPPTGQGGVPPVNSVNNVNPPIRVPSFAGGGGQTLPDVNGGYVPLNPGTTIVPEQPPRTNEGDPDPEPPVAQNNNSNPPQDPPKEDPNRGIEIKVTKGQRPIGGTEPIREDTGGNSLQNLLSAAQEQYLVGQFAKAASLYEQALRAGGDQGRVNQRIGQCYERLGKTSEAIAAYTRAEANLQAAVNAGRTSAKPTLEAVQRALRNLRGA